MVNSTAKASTVIAVHVHEGETGYTLPPLVALAGTELRTHLNLVWPRQIPLTPAAGRVRDLILERFG